MKHVDTAMVAFAAVVTAIHLFVYRLSTGSPLATSPPSWHGYWDQSQYVRSAVAFAEGNLAASEHWYALGYPLLGVPFLRLFPEIRSSWSTRSASSCLPSRFSRTSGRSSARSRA